MASYVEKLKEVRNPHLERTLKGAIGSAMLDIKGATFYVDSNNGADTSGGLSWDNALATVDAAVNLCVANRGDLILIAPNHAETFADATGLVLDVDGINIVGVGVGTDRPTFTFSTAITANIPLSADNVYIENILCLANFDSITSGITISGTDCILKNIEWRDTTDIEAVTAINLEDTANRTTIDGFFHNGFVTGDACDTAISIDGVDGVLITNCAFLGNYATAIVEFVTAACTNVIIEKSIFLETGTTNYSKNVIDTITGSVWSAEGFDIGAGSRFSGGSGAALAGDDVSAISTALAVVDTNVDTLITKNPVQVTFAAADVLDNVQNALFTVAGGRVKITDIVLEVSVAAVDAGASATKLISNPTVGTDMDLCATLDIDADENGTLYSITGTVGDAMTGGSGGGAQGMANGIIVAEGTIDILSAADSGTGGALLGATIEYIPVDTGAAIS